MKSPAELEDMMGMHTPDFMLGWFMRDYEGKREECQKADQLLLAQIEKAKPIELVQPVKKLNPTPKKTIPKKKEMKTVISQTTFETVITQLLKIHEELTVKAMVIFLKDKNYDIQYQTVHVKINYMLQEGTVLRAKKGLSFNYFLPFKSPKKITFNGPFEDREVRA